MTIEVARQVREFKRRYLIERQRVFRSALSLHLEKIRARKALELECDLRLPEQGTKSEFLSEAERDEDPIWRAHRVKRLSATLAT